MNSKQTTSPNVVRTRLRSWLRNKWIIGGLLVAGLPLCRLAWFIYLSEPSRQITIGPQTTYLTGPLTADGYVNYIAALEQQAAEGATPENNAVVLLWEAFGAKETTVEEWEEQFHRLGAPVPANSAVDEIPLDLLVEASRRSQYYAPFIVHTPDQQVPRLHTVLLPLSQSLREGITRLAGRAGQRMAAGDIDAAWDDILACHRLARLVAQDPFIINSTIGMAHANTASEAAQSLLAADALSAEQARRCLRDLEELPEFRTIADKIDRSERLAILDSATAFARGEPLAPYDETNDVSLALTGAIDWDIVLGSINDHFDRLAAAMRDPDLQQRAHRLKALADEGETLSGARIAFGLQAFLGGRKQASRDLVKVIIGAAPEFYFTALRSETDMMARNRAVHIGFALAAHQREHGAYPESLAALAPDPLDKAPVDPWTGGAFVYHRTEDGFVLYSVGPNQRDDGGGLTSFTGADDAMMDDIIVRVEAD